MKIKMLVVTRIMRLVIALVLLSSVGLSQQKEPAWQEGTLVRVDTALFTGSHVDKPGSVSIFRATGCTYWKKCGWAVTMEVQQPERKLFLQKQIQIHNHISSIHYEDVNLREGDRIRFYQEDQKGVYVVLDRDAQPHTFTLEKVIEGPVPANAMAAQPGTEYPSGFASNSTATAAIEKIKLNATSAPQMSMACLGIEIAPKPDGSEGVQIVHVQPGSAAETANLHPGDIITAIDQAKVRTPMELAAALANRAPGSQVHVDYMFRSSALGYLAKDTVMVLSK